MINIENKVESTRSRSHIYDLLANIYRQEPSVQSLVKLKDTKILAAFNDIGIQLTDELMSKPAEELVEDLAVEFCRLFLGPGPHITPNESAYVAKTQNERQLWGESTVQVKHFIENLGLTVSAKQGMIPDHIAVELELMQKLTAREAEARDTERQPPGISSGDKLRPATEGSSDSHIGNPIGKENTKSIDRCLELEAKFMQEHLIRWIPLFCDKVIQGTKSSFYREMARLTKEFIKSEHEYLAYKLRFTTKAPRHQEDT